MLTGGWFIMRMTNGYKDSEIKREYRSAVDKIKKKRIPYLWVTTTHGHISSLYLECRKNRSSCFSRNSKASASEFS